MVLVASSRSARTALPREQNQPGRRLAQAAQPAGTCRATCFCRACTPAGISTSAIVLPLPTPIEHLYRCCLPHPAHCCKGGIKVKMLRASQERDSCSIRVCRNNGLHGCDGPHAISPPFAAGISATARPIRVQELPLFLKRRPGWESGKGTFRRCKAGSAEEAAPAAWPSLVKSVLFCTAKRAFS